MIDPRVAAIDALLPQTQCTRCGFSGCLPYAEALARGAADIDQCPPGGNVTARALAEHLNRPPKPVSPQYGTEAAPRVAVIDEDVCIGCAKCLPACPTDAIVGARKHLHTVIAVECSGCELCIPTCPVDCIRMVESGSAPLDGPEIQRRAQQYRARYTAHEARLKTRRVERAATLARQPRPGDAP